MDFLIRLFRALACGPRLQIVQLTSRQPGIALHEIQSELSIPEPDASKHMKLLSANGIVDSRPSGRYLLTRPAKPSETALVVLRCVRALLGRYLREDALPEAVQAVCPEREGGDWGVVLDAMQFEFTAYTHLRRLLILRMLCERERADLLAIMRTIGMSHSAARRQTDKLVRRGILREVRSGNRYVMEIPKTLATPFRRSLFAAVREYLTST